MRFEFIHAHRSEFSMAAMIRVLKVSRSGFYYWLKSIDNPSPRLQVRTVRDGKVLESFTQSKGRYGARRIQKDMAADDTEHDIKTIRSSMIRQGLKAKAAKPFKMTTNSDHKLPIAPNLLDRNFTADSANQKWAGDITYLYTSEGWLYLAVIIDLHSRAVIGWSISERMQASLVCNALKAALLRRGFPEQVMVHSDRGSQYCSNDYRDLLSKYSHQQSMSRKGNCWDNACVESFFNSLKVEAIHGEPIMSRALMRQQVFEYIEVDYNRKRRHSALGYLSPEEFEKVAA